MGWHYCSSNWGAVTTVARIVHHCATIFYEVLLYIIPMTVGSELAMEFQVRGRDRIKFRY